LFASYESLRALLLAGYRRIEVLSMALSIYLTVIRRADASVAPDWFYSPRRELSRTGGDGF